ncbi:MAG: AAA family ATPase [Bacilli bacterium]|nr:AAA family ATPase [Bacilli bacterium]
MYLKSIKAYGFKSFADKIEINLGKNINGIVGPNGSGKSNVVDAVRWVLGEQSIKSLRGDNSTDVIFSGSKSRKPLNSATVTLVFDNTDKSLPINYTEVSVKRVMYRTGENEYYLNNEKCRLKDITNILTDTGADKEAFNIISQGKIDEILSTKPTDRRTIFESAAGIVKYRKRKEEAIRKLDRTNTNIDRVNDIISELEQNLIPLKKQSEEAKIYKKYKEELDNLEISLIAHDINKYNFETKNLKKEIDDLNDELIDLTNGNTTYDLDILKLKDSLKETEDNINNNQKLLIELTKNIEKIDANIRVLKERDKNKDNKDNILDKILQIKEKILKEENNINNIKLTIEKKQEELNNNKSINTNNINKMNILKEKQNKLTNNINNNNRKITDIKYKIEYIENNINNNNSLPTSIKNIQNNPRLTGIHNTIGKIINIDNEYNTAINIALGASINYLVVDNTKIAKELVNYLKDNKLGRATFFPLDVIKPRYIDEQTLNNIKNIKGFINTADKLVNYEIIYKNIITNQLGNIIITDNIDTANNISKIINHKYKIVTLDGQVINIGGSITGGSINNNYNIIKEKYDLENNKIELNNLIKQNQNIENDLIEINKELNNYENIIQNDNLKISIIEENINNTNKNLIEETNNLNNLERELKDLETINNNNTNKELETLINTYYSAINNKDNLENTIESLYRKKDNTSKNIEELEQLSKKTKTNINIKEKNIKENELKLNTLNIKMDNLLLELTEEYNMTFDNAIKKYKLDIDESIARNKVKELKNNLKGIENVNLGAIEEYERINTRYEFLNKQKNDLHDAEDTLLEIISEMDNIMQERFITTFEEIRKEFKKVFVSMFKGGNAELILTEPDNILETGIEIQAVPSGKSLKSISLLSGGEKTFTAISLLFAILNVRPVPFCLLDEVEAALDDANVEAFGNYLYKYKDKTQFILITHKKKTMEFIDTLYGITMQESGVSKLVSVRLEDIEK